MTPEELFTAALGLGRQWRVAECRFEGEPKRLELRLEHVPGEHFQGQGAAHLVSHRRGPSGASTLGPGRQRVHPDDGSARDATQCGDARRCHG
jgi:hypothetical protein